MDRNVAPLELLGMRLAAHLVFWPALAFLIYVYAGYPLLVWLRARWRPRSVHHGPETPFVSLVVTAYNEARRIGAKLDNCLELDYPGAQIEILVASDGSDDGTNDIVAGYAARGVQLVPQPRRGKLHAQDAAVALARGDILVFSDANTRLERDALRMLVRNFADPAVGGVCGNQRHVRQRHGDSSVGGERTYWSYDKWMKECESRAGSIVAADGALYAIRRGLYRKPEIASVTDDFAISTGVVAAGSRLVFDPEAIAWEEAAGRAGGEFARKTRITSRGWQGVWLRRSLLDPRKSGFYAVVLWSHKVLRRLAPVALLLLLAASLAGAATDRWLAIAATLQVGFYLLALCGWMLRRTALGKSKLLALPFFFVLANAAALVGLVRTLRGQRIETWQPQRGAPGQGDRASTGLALEETGAP